MIKTVSFLVIFLTATFAMAQSSPPIPPAKLECTLWQTFGVERTSPTGEKTWDVTNTTTDYSENFVVAYDSGNTYPLLYRNMDAETQNTLPVGANAIAFHTKAEYLATLDPNTKALLRWQFNGLKIDFTDQSGNQVSTMNSEGKDGLEANLKYHRDYVLPDARKAFYNAESQCIVFSEDMPRNTARLAHAKMHIWR